jgi:hypothetical protein
MYELKVVTRFAAAPSTHYGGYKMREHAWAQLEN